MNYEIEEGHNQKDLIWMWFAEVGLTKLHALWQLMRHYPKIRGGQKRVSGACEMKHPHSSINI